MQIVIDIPEEIKAIIDKNGTNEIITETLWQAVKNGTPQQRTGRWINSHIPESTLCECSACGFTCGAYSFNYCPNCGAKMEVKE